MSSPPSSISRGPRATRDSSTRSVPTGARPSTRSVRVVSTPDSRPSSSRIAPVSRAKAAQASSSRIRWPRESFHATTGQRSSRTAPRAVPGSGATTSGDETSLGSGPTRRPSRSSRTRSAASINISSWVATSTARPSSLAASPSRRVTRSAVSRSRFPVGSSASRTGVVDTSPRASTTRARSPADSRRPSSSASASHCSPASSRRARARAWPSSVPAIQPGRQALSRELIRWTSQAPWGTRVSALRRSRARAAALRPGSCRPATDRRPWVNGRMPAIRCRRVVFPTPEGPTSATSSPRATSRSTRSRIVAPWTLWFRPRQRMPPPGCASP